jgi:hypothetical protein
MNVDPGQSTAVLQGVHALDVSHAGGEFLEYFGDATYLGDNVNFFFVIKATTTHCWSSP